MQIAFPHDERIRLRLCFTEPLLRPAAQSRVRLHLHIGPTAPEHNERAAGSAGRKQCTASVLGEQADSISVSGRGSDKALPNQNCKTGSDCVAPLQQECNAAVAAGAAHETHISTIAEQQKVSAIKFCTAIPENSTKDRPPVCEQHEASGTAAEAPSADARSNGHLLVEDASNMCDIGGVETSEGAPEPHSMTTIKDSQQCGPATAESPMQGSIDSEASYSVPELHACNQSAGASLSSPIILDMLTSSPGCLSPRHMHRQPAAHSSYTPATAELHAQTAAANHLKSAAAHELSMGLVQSDTDRGESVLELALLAAGSSAPDRQPIPDRQPELKMTAAGPYQELSLSGSAEEGHSSSQPADHAAGPQLMEPLRLMQAEPVEGAEVSTVHVTAQLQVLGEVQQLPEDSLVQVHLVVSL